MEIHIDPLACPRPRITTRGKFAHAYYPASYKNWKEEAAQLLQPLAPSIPLAGPLVVTAFFHVKKPKTSKLTHPKPDIDNYLKSLFDALTAVGWWEDDNQVVKVVAEKMWAPSGVLQFYIENVT